MICIIAGCTNELWKQTRRETEDAAIASGWRFRGDAKAPELSAGAAICPTCVATGEEANWQPAAKKARA